MDPKILELRRLVVLEAIWGDETWRKAVTEALPVIEAIGARVAVLKAENREAREWLERRTGELKAELQEQRAIEEGLRERLSAAEEGNRELVRRAQQAEALVEHERRNMESWRRMADRMRERWEDAQARCATLSAAGQGLSAHVDNENAAKECRWSAGCGNVARAPCGYCDFHCGHARGICAGFKRYPCSPTCTHDDAAKPGHPERVKERSEAVNEELRRPENDADTFVTIPNGVEGVVFTRSQTERYADKRAEAMRAACWEAVHTWAQIRGLGKVEMDTLKSAIEGAVP